MKKLLIALLMLPMVAFATDNNLQVTLTTDTQVKYTVLKESMQLKCGERTTPLRKGDRVAFKLAGMLVEVYKADTQMKLDLPAIVIVGETCRLY